MNGTTPTKSQRHYWSLLCGEIGCVACMKDGIFNSHCLPHHIDGRTKPNSHWLVLPLCPGHHQDGTGAPGLIAIHPWKARFEAKYGCQMNLLRECLYLLQDGGFIVPDAALEAAGIQKQNPDTLAGVPGLQSHSL